MKTKTHYRVVATTCFIVLAAMISSGCASNVASLRERKGGGARCVLMGQEAELVETAANALQSSNIYTVTREPHAVFGTTGSVSYGFYFYPTQHENQTEVEVIVSAPILSDKQVDGFQKTACADFFPVNYTNMRLLDPNYNPNIKTAHFFALTSAAYEQNTELVYKLLKRGAKVDLAISELKGWAQMQVEFLNKPGFKERYDKINLAVTMLSGLKGEADNMLKADKRRAVEAENETAFQAALRSYQSALVKSQLPEDARKFKVQAEGAVRDKDFAGAVDLYGQALKIAPWWPEGHFNRALVLGETKEFNTAIMEMRRYIRLVPDAPNARAAQDYIYDWERKAGKGD